MNIVRYALQNRTVMSVLLLMITVGGYLAYGQLGRLEDPDFTIKEAVIVTTYSGATAQEVEQEITEPLETAIQSLKQLEEVRSTSRDGMSIIFAEVQDSYDKDTIPQVWDELRRKVNGAASSLPPGAGQPLVNDDFGDVFGLFFAITGDGYSAKEIQDVAEDLRRELLLCEDVGKIDFWGFQQEAVYVEIDREKLSQLGVSPVAIFNTINQQNTVTSAGKVQVGSQDVRFRVTGDYDDVKSIGEQFIKGDDNVLIRVKDIATISEGYIEPASQLLLQDGIVSVGLGISTVAGGNVVVMGDSVKERLAELKQRLPVGMEIHTISYQSDTVRTAVNGFVLNLVEAVLIVVVLLVLFMGVREGIIIGLVLLLTILATFIAMLLMDINLQRISLGALIIALGMLVDNAIVVTEGIVVKKQKGISTELASVETVKETQWPLLGATFIAILAFAAISLSKDVTGEFLGSLFKVIALSLSLSWIFAVAVVPYLCALLLPDSTKSETELHNNWFFRGYKRLLARCIRFRWLTILSVLIILAGSLYSFRYVDQNFFPDSTRPQFMVDLSFPEGTHISATEKTIQRVGKHIRGQKGVTGTTAFVGSGGLRFILTYNPEMLNSAYGQLLVSVSDYREIDSLIEQVEDYLDDNVPEAVATVNRFVMGPGGGAVAARFQGPDATVLRNLGEQARRIMLLHENTSSVNTDWGARIKVAEVHMSASRSNEIGVTRPEIAQALAGNFSGNSAGLYRKGDKLLPIIVRPTMEQRSQINEIENVQVYTSSIGRTVPISQVTDEVATVWEDPVIKRRDRTRTLTVSCSQVDGTVASLFTDLRPLIEGIELPPGYSLEWGGEYEESLEANQKLMAKVPLAFSLMFLVSVMLFNNLRNPIIIFLGLPMALVGVVVGLLSFNQPFGFMALLGFLSLSGMLMKNEIVLLDQIELERKAGKSPYNAVIDSAASRVRPVAMAAFTTILGMIPLLWDAFFVAMAVTIMGGLTFATLLTLIVVPVLYSTLYGVREEAA